MTPEVATLIACAPVAWLITVGARRWVDQQERRKACSHDLYLDDTGHTYEYAVLRCSKGCGYQEPARAYIAEKQREHRERVAASLVSRCPRCGEEVPPGA